jgi:hypothetical protein
MIGGKCDFTVLHPGLPVPERLVECGSDSHFRGMVVVTS